VEIFLSHATTDLEVAESIRIRLEELPDIRCRLIATDVLPGADWEVAIRQAAIECDAIASLVTPEYIGRPWFYAEWAVFWFQPDKLTIPMLLETSPTELFEVMARRQAVHLGDRRSVESLIRRLSEGRELSRGADLIAHDLVSAAADARRRSKVARVGEDLLMLRRMLLANTLDIDPDLVASLIALDKLEEVVQVACDTSLTHHNVKLRQLGAALIQIGFVREVGAFVERIENLAERRTVGYFALRALRDGVEPAAALELVIDIYRSVLDPQRRNLRDRCTELGLYIDWPAVETNP
jgi:hypothetical protein